MRLGTLASAILLPGVTSVSLSPSPLLGPVLGLATTQHPRQVGRVNCTCSSTLSAKWGAPGGSATSKQPSEWVGRLLVASREKLVAPEDPGLSHAAGGQIHEPEPRPLPRPGLGLATTLASPAHWSSYL